jgi:hypothetical protein
MLSPEKLNNTMTCRLNVWSSVQQQLKSSLTPKTIDGLTADAQILSDWPCRKKGQTQSQQHKPEASILEKRWNDS